MRRLLAILFVLAWASTLEAASLVAVADGNLTTAATWKAGDATATLISSSTSATALTTGNLDSATFTPGAITVSGLALRLSTRAAGSPTNTLTATLRNSTDATNLASVTINVSDLTAQTSATSSIRGGWIYLKFNGDQTLTAAKAYVVRLTLSSTSTAVSFQTNGTANNWQRILVLSTTGAPAAGDDMFVQKQYDGATNPATTSDRTVTMDSTAATDYGSANTSWTIPALSISNGGTVTFGTTASTNYILRLSGWVTVYKGGTLTIGSAGTPIPPSSSAVLEFDCAADNDFGLIVLGDSTLTTAQGGVVHVNGSPRTAGKLVTWTTLTADVAAGASTVSVAADTGWLNGDTVVFAPTTASTGGNTQREEKVLNADAGASSMTLTTTLGFAHLGTTAPFQGEVALVTRNVIIRAVTAGQQTDLYFYDGSDADFSWAQIKNISGTNSTNLGNGGIKIQSGSTGTYSFDYITVSNSENGAFWVDASSTQDVRINRSVFYALTGSGCCNNEQLTWGGHTGGNTWQVTDNVFLSAGTNLNLNLADSGGTFTGNHIAGGGVPSQIAFVVGEQFTNFYGNVCHNSAAFCWQFGNSFADTYTQTTADKYTLGDITPGRENLIWHNQNTGLNFGAAYNFNLYGWKCLGVSVGPCANFASDSYNVRIQHFYSAATASKASTYGIAFQSNVQQFECIDCEMGTGTGHTQADVYFGAGTITDAVFWAPTLNSTTKIAWTPSSYARGSSMSVVNLNGATALSVYTSEGILSYETTTVDVSPALKMAFSTGATSRKFQSNGGVRGMGFVVPVESGRAITVSVKVRKDGSYTGAAPRLVLKDNPVLGFTSDVVLDTLSVGANTWETLTGTTSAATARGVLEFVVDGDGTAGAVYVDTWRTPGGSTRLPGDFAYFGAFPFTIWMNNSTTIGR